MEAAASSIAAVIERFNDLGFANVVFSSGAFPTTLQNIVGDEEIPRLDKQLYEDVTVLLTFDLHYGTTKHSHLRKLDPAIQRGM
jgi:DNA-binding transcriptional regulator of glucitol operon